MKLPISWLKDFVDIGNRTPEDISTALFGIGFEVEEIIFTGEGISGVVTAKVIECEKHENSDHLHICKVDTGSKILDIVCGAPNVRVGNVVPCAVVGAKLPGDFVIKESKIRGVKSFGMLCSGSKLGIDDNVYAGAEVDGLLQLPTDTKLGQDIIDVLGLNDYILDVSITANRPDCQSIAGISREVAAALGLAYNPPKVKYSKKPLGKTYMPTVEITADACSRYTGRLIQNVKIEQSPKWLRDRLRLVGVRAINNVVDITNYVLFEVGQPLHAFDVNVIDKGIVVRNALKGEKIVALDGQKYSLTPEMMVIADKSKGLAIAGIMGGENSGINDSTNCVFLEAARFERSNIRKSSRKLGLRSDSSARYEKGVDYMSVDMGRERALTLFEMLGAGEIVDAQSDAGIARPKEKIITTSSKQISDLIGIEISKSKIENILKALDFGVSSKGDNIVCAVPLFREDIDNFTDIAEEVIRYYGYDHIVPTFLNTAKCTVGGIPDDMKQLNDVKSILCGAGAYEMMAYSFINNDAFDKLGLDKDDKRRDVLKLFNPLNEDLAVMRTQLSSSMLSAISLNLSRGNDNVRLFETGIVYLSNGHNVLPSEKRYLSIGLVGDGCDFYEIKGIVGAVLDYFNVNASITYSKESYLHPGISAEITYNGKVLGNYGKVHPTTADKFNIAKDCYIAEIDLSQLIGGKFEQKKYSEISKFPAVKRDLAILVKDEAQIGDLMSTIKSASGKYLEDVHLFDVYKGSQITDGYKSVAFSLKFRAVEKTLTDNDIQGVMKKIVKNLNSIYGAELRQ